MRLHLFGRPASFRYPGGSVDIVWWRSLRFPGTNQTRLWRGMSTHAMEQQNTTTPASSLKPLWGEARLDPLEAGVRERGRADCGRGEELPERNPRATAARLVRPGADRRVARRDRGGERGYIGVVQRPSALLPRKARQVEALIAGAYLSATNARKAKHVGALILLDLILDFSIRKILEVGVHETDSAERAALLARHTALAKSVHAMSLRLVQHGHSAARLKRIVLAKLHWLPTAPSHSRPRVSDDYAFAEALFRTAEYRPEFRTNGSADLNAARAWARAVRALA